MAEQTPTGTTVVPSEDMALVPAGQESPALTMFERLASDPNVDVEKFERLIRLQERILEHNAKAAFNAAFSEMQNHIPILDETGTIRARDGSARSTYTPLEDIHAIVKPICARFGFAIRHRTEWPADKPNIIRIVGILSHIQGHSEQTAFEAPMDKSDYRTDIQSQGSTVSYGRRYTTLDLLNISTRKMDTDGQTKKAVLEKFALLPESVRDSLEKAFAGLKMTEGQRLTRLNEFLARTWRTDEENAEALLQWCREEYARREHKVYTPKGDTNKKSAEPK